MKNQETYLPNFAGFYESVYQNSDMFIDAAYSLWDDPREVDPREVDWKLENLCDYINWHEYQQNVCKKYVQTLNEITEKVGITLTFKEVTYPREYNFTTNRIYCDVEFDVGSIKSFILKNEDKYRDLLDKHLKSCSGFTSWHAPDFDEAMLSFENEKYTEFNPYLLVLLDLVEKVEGWENSDVNEDVWEYLSSNGQAPEDFIDYKKLDDDFAKFEPLFQKA